MPDRTDDTDGGDDAADRRPDPGERVAVTVRDGDREATLDVAPGTVLRDALLAAGFSPYTRLTDRLNCGGRGLCATCGVRVLAGDHDPEHWHDRLADRFGYPRLSCRMRVTEDLTVAIPEKRIWGERRPGDDAGE